MFRDIMGRSWETPFSGYHSPWSANHWLPYYISLLGKQNMGVTWRHWILHEQNGCNLGIEYIRSEILVSRLSSYCYASISYISRRKANGTHLMVILHYIDLFRTFHEGSLNILNPEMPLLVLCCFLLASVIVIEWMESKLQFSGDTWYNRHRRRPPRIPLLLGHEFN